MENKLSKIRIIGVGGMGCAAISRRVEKQEPEEETTVEYYVIDCDCGRLNTSQCENKIQIPAYGFSGATSEYTEKIAFECNDKFEEVVDGAEFVVLVAGLGGGLGSAVAPIVAGVAKDKGILTVAVVSTPCPFEGNKRTLNSVIALRKLQTAADMTVVIPHEKLQDILSPKEPVSKLFSLADSFADCALNALASSLSLPSAYKSMFGGYKQIIAGAGEAYLGLGVGNGEERAVNVTRLAVHSPIDDRDIQNAKGVIAYLEGGNNLDIKVIFEVRSYIKAVCQSANVQFSANPNAGLGDELRLTLIAVS